MGANVQNYMEQGGARWVIGASGELDILGVLKKDGVDLTEQASFTKYARFTVAQVNAGAEILPAITGKKYRVTAVKARAIGGAAGAVTTVDIADGASSPVVIATFAQAQLTEDALLISTSTGVTLGAGFLVGTTAAKNITVGKTGDDITTATHIDFVIEYQIVA